MIMGKENNRISCKKGWKTDHAVFVQTWWE